MSLDTLGAIVFVVMTVGGWIGMKVCDRFTYIKHQDQKAYWPKKRGAKK